MKKLFILFLFVLSSLNVFGQDCTIISKSNNISPDRLCAPVTVNWNISYGGVNNAGTPVQIRYVWGDGTTQTIPATNLGGGIWTATLSHIYTSRGRICNYHPQATLIVNGVVCTSSTQEQIVTVWDDDNHNGGVMRINPAIWPICFGNSANARFQDLTQFNCVPPQERDNPNVNTRWIQWIYGTDITMTGIPVTINGNPKVFPYTAPVVTLVGPVTSSGVWSDIINVANDKLIGQYFQVTLRNWNYCNPYDDPNIPGLPIDLINGDHPPVITTARVLIVDYPDATINSVTPMCANAPSVTLTAVTNGGTWSGTGIVGNIFNPSIAGAGSHIVRYSVTNSSGCNSIDTTIIVVKPIPNAIITPIGTVCEETPPIILTAVDTGGVWSGPGVVGNIFSPLIAGFGNHTITYNISANGCNNSSQTIISVASPNATINQIDTICVDNPVITLTAHDMGGIWSGNGVVGDKFNPSVAGVGSHLIIYNLNDPICNDIDSIIITVMPVPNIMINPVGTIFINTPPITLKSTPNGGIWSGMGVINDSIFDPSIMGAGNWVIKYETIPDRWGCMSFDTIHIQVLIPPPPISNFSPDTIGCSPLTIQFVNTSLYGEVYTWDFGDGIYSKEKNPLHTYFIPGNYIVKLIVNNISGQSVYNNIIIVHKNPTAIFEVYPLEVVTSEQIVVFKNYSYNAATYLWDFGDGTTSIENSPYHKYEKEGKYEVSLWAYSSEGCIDSAKLYTPINVEWKEGYIRFSNVFKWNESGPTGGQWRDGYYPEMDYVFRPFFENVIEYKLQIFNRWGVLIYESTDLYKGWDGYWGKPNPNKLAMQGVYVWKVTGRFANGDYFDKVGDVTFLH